MEDIAKIPAPTTYAAEKYVIVLEKYTRTCI